MTLYEYEWVSLPLQEGEWKDSDDYIDKDKGSPENKQIESVQPDSRSVH